MTNESPFSPASTRLWWITPVALVAALFAMSSWAYGRLPATIVIQTLWTGRSGHPQSAAQFAFTVPVLVGIGVLVNLLAAHWNVLVWPAKALSSSDAAVMRPLAMRLFTIGAAQFIVTHGFALAAALGWISEIAGLRGAGVALGLALAIAGNSLPLVTRRNSFVGYRLTTFYNDPDRWRTAQRMAGYCFVAAGLVLAAVFVVAPVLGNRLLLPVVAITLIAPVLLTRRAGQRGAA